MVHEIKNWLEIGELNTFQVQKGMGIKITPKHTPKKGRAYKEDDFVNLNLLIITNQGHVEEIFIVPKLTKRYGNI